MSEYSIFFQLGLQHILDIKGYDHILFVVALCAIYSASDWRNVLVLITAFTFGHSITLALSALSIVDINQDLVEFLIPITILITALANILRKNNPPNGKYIQINYWFAAFFGLIHGLGFSGYFKSLLGRDSSIVTQLLAFNLGLEAGQIVIVACMMLGAFVCLTLIGVQKKYWTVIISSIVAGASLILIIGNRI